MIPRIRLPLIALAAALFLTCLLPAGPALAAEPSEVQWAGVWTTNKYGRELRLQQSGQFVYGFAEGVRIIGFAGDSRTFHGHSYLGSGDGSMGVVSHPVRLVMAADNKSFTGWWGDRSDVYTGTLASVAYGRWDATWDTAYGPVWLQSSGKNVWGGYERPDGIKGQITAAIKGNVLSGTWQEGKEWGLFEFTMDLRGDSFTGWRGTSTRAW
ncbi:MAG TPA: hypothetical protein VN521_01830, partial [Negativicutes bacterium]|nr:hypothetical protein [Negativicutes bacterium]